MLKDLIIKKYESSVYNRTDDDGCVFYFSHSDFPELNVKEYNFHSSKGDLLKGNFYYYDNPLENHIIVFDHGMGGGHLSYFREIELLCKKGYMVYSYDHTGCMASGGKMAYGLTGSLNDLDDCFNALEKDFPDYTFDCIGHSWGGFSTMNIVNYHKNIKHIVAISGFVSVVDMMAQQLHGMFKGVYEDVVRIEEKHNGKFAMANGVESLMTYPGNALIIHSNNDKMVSFKYHFLKLQKNLNNKENIEFLVVKNKGHNPNYLDDAIKYKDKFFKAYMKALKHNKLETEEQKETFKNSFDWERMTAQDMDVWNKIFTFLEK